MLRTLIAATLLFSFGLEAKSPKNWKKFVDNYLEQWFKANPALAVNQGRHEYDGQFPDWSEKGLNAEIARLKQSIADAQAFPTSALSREQRFERDYLVAQARGDLFWREVADQPHHNPAYYFDRGLDPSVYAARPYAPVETRLRAYIKYLKAMPGALAHIRANLKTPLPRSFINYGKSAFAGFAEYYLGDGKKAFAQAKDAALQREMDEAAKVAAAAMIETVNWLQGLMASATENFALGADKFAQMVRDTEMVDVGIDQLDAIARGDLKRNQDAMKEACAKYAPGASIGACVDKMNADKPKGGPVAGARAQLAGLKAFIKKHNLVSIPGKEEALVEEAPAYNRQNSAYINIPGPYEKGMPSAYNIAPPDPTWTKEVQDAFVPGNADLLFTSVHEVWPGHFLNFLHANRSKFMFGRVFVGYAFAEGWAHYVEEMMYDAGLGKGEPEMRIGQLSNALLRNCRFVSAIGLHSGKMTMEESFKLFREQCYIDEGNARQQAARGTYDPAYLNYTMGKLMIIKLREDWTKTRGGRKAWKAFHDKFLSYGGPPIPLVRQQMMGGKAEAKF